MKINKKGARKKHARRYMRQQIRKFIREKQNILPIKEKAFSSIIRETEFYWGTVWSCEWGMAIAESELNKAYWKFLNRLAYKTYTDGLPKKWRGKERNIIILRDEIQRRRWREERVRWREEEAKRKLARIAKAERRARRQQNVKAKDSRSYALMSENFARFHDEVVKPLGQGILPDLGNREFVSLEFSMFIFHYEGVYVLNNRFTDGRFLQGGMVRVRARYDRGKDRVKWKIVNYQSLAGDECRAWNGKLRLWRLKKLPIYPAAAA